MNIGKPRRVIVLEPLQAPVPEPQALLAKAAPESGCSGSPADAGSTTGVPSAAPV